MKKFLALILAAQFAFVAGCASTPEENAEVQDLQQRVEQLESSDSESLAPVAVAEAREAVEELRDMYEQDADKAEIEHRRYLAEKRIEIAKETVAMKKSEKTVAASESRRKDVLLEAERQQVRNVQDRMAKMSARAEELQRQVQDLETRETDRGLVLTLGSVLFETGQATLESGGRRTIEQVARFLKEYPEREILIEGFTDNMGDENYNQQLSQQRAQAVMNLLTSYGVDPSRITTEGYGEEFPVANNNSSSGRQQNRRVEIVVGKRDGAGVSERTSMR